MKRWQFNSGAALTALVASACLSACLSACGSAGVQVSEKAALQFQEGVSTEQDVVSTLGKPSTVIVSNGVRLLAYSGMQYQVKGATWIPVVGAFAGGADYQTSSAVFQIDGRGIVKKITYTATNGATQSGLAPAAMQVQTPRAVP